MEKSTQIATVQRMTPNFVQNAMESIESAMKYADILLKSKLVPNHFFEKGSDGKPDYNKGKPEAIVLVLQHGMEVGLSVTQSLQQVVPVNGLISIKGDGAKSLILTSGICDVWDERISGSIEAGDYACEIYSKRRDGKEKTVKFTLNDAIRADLFYTDAQLKAMQSAGDWQQKKANAFKYSAWYKYPTRMVGYRCIGFISRDLYPDVLQGMVTTEEAQDYKEDGTVSIETGDGKRLQIKESAHNAMNETSERLSKSTTAGIDKANGSHKPPIQEAEVVTEQEASVNWWEGTYLADMKSGIYDFAKQILPEAKYRLLEIVPQRKSNALYREALLTFHNGGLLELDKWLTKALGPKNNDSNVQQGDNTTSEEKVVPATENTEKKDDMDILNTKPGGMTTSEATKSFEAQRSVSQPAGAQQGSMFPNQEAEEEFKIPTIDPTTGERRFADVYKLRSHLIKLGMKDSDVEGGLEKFCKKASNEMVQEEINVAIQKSM